MIDSVTVTVSAVRYPSADADNVNRAWRIIHTDNGVFKGSIGWRPVKGEKIKFSGLKKSVSPRYGVSYDFSAAEHDIPTDERAALAYACSLTKGIGEVIEQKIWDAMHSNWRDVTRVEVPALSSTALSNLQTTIQTISTQKERTNAMNFLFSLGCTPRMADVAWEKWGIATIGTVQGDIYSLASLPNYSFREVESKVDLSRFGITKNDARRIDAAIMYVAGQLSEKDTAINWVEFRDGVYSAIDSDHADILDRVSIMFGNGRLVRFDTNRLALSSAYRAEKAVYDFIVECA